MASDQRPYVTSLINTPAQVGDSLREKRERNGRVCTHAQRLQGVLDDTRRRHPQLGVYTLDLLEHGAPKDFNIVDARRRVKKPHVAGSTVSATNAVSGTDEHGQEQQGQEQEPDQRGLVQERGQERKTRAKWQEEQFIKHFIDADDERRMINARHARREERPVIGTNFVPDSIDDLPDDERLAVLRSRRNCGDRLQYEIRNTDIYRDGWRLFVKEREGQILAPPFGKVGVC
jgi:hypothetical protein